MTQLIQDYPTKLGVSYGDFVRNLFRPLAPSAMLAHAAMGVVTEIQELTDATTAANAVEEAGDIAFFCVAFIQTLPFQFSKEEADIAAREVFLQYCLKHGVSPTTEVDGTDVAELIFELSIEMLDAAKRWLAYDKAPTQEACVRLAGCAELIAGFALAVTDSAAEAFKAQGVSVIDVNVAKLQHRYKGGFSTEAAVDRDVASELEVIQGAASNS